MVNSWSATRAVIVLCYGEAEDYGVVKEASQGLGMQAMVQDLGMEVSLRLGSDASTARCIAARRGVGNVRRIEVCQLWLQEKVQEGNVRLMRVKGIDNPADVLTNHVGKRY